MARILVTGATGQVGWEAQRCLSHLGQVVALDRRSFNLSDVESIDARLDAIQPQIIVNAAAYTAVDDAERNFNAAVLVNAEAPRRLGRWARRRNALVVHFSSDYVFDGSGDKPWKEDDKCAPLSAYGRSKALGETALLDEARDALILRTSWVYAARGENFLKTMLRLGAQRGRVRVVDDQHGAPTPARLVGEVVSSLLVHRLNGRASGLEVLHLAAAGETTWHGFASEIFRMAARLLPWAADVVVDPIASHEFPALVKRPLNSRLDLKLIAERYGLVMPEWADALALVYQDLEAGYIEVKNVYEQSNS